MPVSSMTGFARTEGEREGCSWACEIKSVNAKGLDLRLRLPHGYDELEKPVRDLLGQRFKRGSISVSVTASRQDTLEGYRINQDVLDQIMAVLPDIQKRLPDSPPPSVEGLLAMRGVLEMVEHEESEEEHQALGKALLDGVDEAVQALGRGRDEEGARLAAVLTGQIDQIEGICQKAEASAGAQPDALKRRLTEQVQEILEAAPTLAEDRLAQEVALLVAKADVREELDRLDAHIAAARDLMADGAAIGRRLDFLCQEFLRETNTLCSKSADVDLTRCGLDLKAVIEQFREQVQNIE